MRLGPLPARERIAAALLSAFAVQACNSPDRGAPRTEPDASSPAPSALAVLAVDASPAPTLARLADGKAMAPAGPTAVFIGSYRSTPSALYVPPEWKVRWRPEETDSGTGDGQLTLALEPEGRVRGTVEGPLGPAVIEGYAKEGAVTAKISRKDPADHGFSGTLTATQTTGRLEGTMSLSLAAGGALRSATFVLVPGDAGASP